MFISPFSLKKINKKSFHQIINIHQVLNFSFKPKADNNTWISDTQQHIPILPGYQGLGICMNH